MLPWRWILPGLGGLLAVWAAYSWAYGRGKAHEHARMQPQLDAALWSVGQLSDALNEQTAAVERAGRATQAAQDVAAGAGKVAQERAKALAAVKARLDAAARAGGPVAACKTSPVAVDAWKVM